MNASRIILGILRTVSIPILLTEAGIRHPSYDRSENAKQTELRSLQWRDSVFNTKLKALYDNYRKSNRKKSMEKIGLLASFGYTEGLRESMLTSHKPSYFDLKWKQINQISSIDMPLGQSLEDGDDLNGKLNAYVCDYGQNCTCVYTDASQIPFTGGSAISFYIPSSGIRYGLRTSSLHSILSLEFLAISASYNMPFLKSLRIC